MTADSASINNCALVILAAGQSSRLGRPKQLLTYHNKTLLQRAIDTAKQSAVQSIILVLGSNADIILRATDISETHVVKNDDWQSGMASTIRCGIEGLKTIDAAIDAVILMVCDQPFVTPDLLNDLIKKQRETSKPIVASEYVENIGTPALFHERFFAELMALKGDAGAKKIMLQYSDLVETISFPDGGIDIDTIDDYKALGE
jgi:molybdenum cofactor cytidylyltransferase